MTHLEPNLVAVMMMVVLSSFTLAAIVACFGKTAESLKPSLLCISLLCFGLAYVLFCFLQHPQKNIFFVFANIAFSAGLSTLLATVLHFYRRPIPVVELVLLPLTIGLVFGLLQEQPMLRTRMVALLNLVQPLCALVLIARLRHLQLGKGEWIFLGGLLLILAGTVARMLQPHLSITLASNDEGLRVLKMSYAIFFIALHFLTIGLLLMEHERKESNLKKESGEDMLTGTASRRRMLEILQARIHASRCTKQHLSLLLLDIDHFKNVNDQCGHIAGDHVLSAVGKLLCTHVRQGSTVGRYGGEEFLIICPSTNSDQAALQAERLRTLIEERIQAQGNGLRLKVTASIGIYTHEVNAPDKSWEDLVNYADSALYQAKNLGRNQARSYQISTASSSLMPVFNKVSA